ncbi:MAG TPA: protein kinase [Patescibacteria group bacterium]|nr:protein kinase [Patescibacteria group bacterium]
MPLAPGTRLGPYEILAPLGAGGMGEVYRARDTRLNRSVAIKVLPAHLSSNPDVRLRFEREARAVSSLNHPNICTLHDIGSQDGVDYLVLEHLEGETLAARLQKGPMPTAELLRCAIEIADALDRAHRQGLIHRDLKPGNIMLTKSGAKLLDFGLARATGLGGVAGDLSHSPTMGQPLTAEGTIVGTFQYMAPEQLEGKEADARTDIFAFGAVLYEMATGRRAFQGKSQASLITAIMSAKPEPLTTVATMAPASLERIVSQCLAKDPDDRWQSAGDLKRELRWISEAGSGAVAPITVVARRNNREPLAWMIAVILALAAVALGAVLLRRPAPAEPLSYRFSIPPPDKAIFDLTLAFSPDGRRLAFVASLEGRRLLWLQSLSSFEARPLPDTDGATMPFWSPDGRHVGFFADGKLKRIDTIDGSIQALAPVTDPRGGSWSKDGIILFSPATTTPLYSIPASGGEAKTVSTLDESKKESSHRWPWFLPDGRHFLYFARSGDKNAEAIYVASLDGGDRVRLVSSHSSVQYVAPGYLLFVRDKTLVAQPFDATRLSLSGEASTVAQNVELMGENGPSAYAAFSVTDDGLLGFLQAGSNLATQLTWYDRTGKSADIVAPLAFYDEPALSPDGKHVVMDLTDPKNTINSIWALDLSQGKLSRFSFGKSDDTTPIWSPDGTQVVYSSNTSGFWDLYMKASSGVTGETLLLSSNANKFANDWSADGRYIVYENNDPNTGNDIWILPMTGDRKPKPYLQTKFNETHSQISPDGHWIVFASDESGRSEVYVQTFPSPGGKFQISTEGGDQPSWKRDGREIYYISQDNKLTAVTVNPGSSFEAGTPKVLFNARIPYSGLTGSRIRYCASPDGQRFLLDSIPEQSAASPMRVIMNWAALLKK